MPRASCTTHSAFEVPVDVVLAVLPHGPGVEFLLPARISGRSQAAVVVASLDIRPMLVYGRGNTARWPSGTSHRRKAMQLIRQHSGCVIDWRPQRANDEDYWSGYPSASDHGVLYFTVPATRWEQLKQALVASAGNEPYPRTGAMPPWLDTQMKRRCSA